MVDAESLSFICPTRLNKARRLRPFAAHRINLHNADQADVEFRTINDRFTLITATLVLSRLRADLGHDRPDDP